VVIQWRQRIFLFICLCFWCVLLFCKLLQRDLGELVSMMERNSNCSMKTLHGMCESWLCMGIGRKVYGEQMDEDGRNIFDVG